MSNALIATNKADVYLLKGENADWISVSIEPFNKFSAGGGRITVNIGDDHIGSYFFSHGGPASFIEFISQTSPAYLEGKLFRTAWSRPMNSSDELLEWIKANGMEKVKDARSSGLVSKKQLRSVYGHIVNQDSFEGVGELWRYMANDDCAVMDAIFGCDWYCSGEMSLPNELRKVRVDCVHEVISAFKDMVTDQANKDKDNDK